MYKIVRLAGGLCEGLPANLPVSFMASARLLVTKASGANGLPSPGNHLIQ